MPILEGRIPPAEVIKTLAQKFGYLHADGSVNSAQFGRAAGLSNTTIWRFLNGDVQDMSPKVAAVLMEAFNLTEAQARGYEPIEMVETILESGKASKKDLAFIRRFRSIAPKDQQEIEQYIRLLTKIKNRLKS